MEKKTEQNIALAAFFQENNRVALAFSGGVDSSYLLYEAIRQGVKIQPYYVKSAFQPEFEYQDALRLAKELGAELKVIHVDVLASKQVTANPANRCYYCKNCIFSTILKEAAKDGYEVILDGTNASDDAADRPGMQALCEMKVRSPLRECGLTKKHIRQLSKEAGLFTWDKPAYACLATRIPTGEEITREKLEATEAAESFLFSQGFSDFRVRFLKGCARIQLPHDQLSLLLEKRQLILETLKRDYQGVVLDLETRGE
ncbi:MAG: ATP-dependent sacrificial sulfur transferase LarE [Lachnospiraceae bacterium]|nr:ATP-dependent sacrificial sulfur transferase LarE [Lachnospiraceae bacterium]MDD7026609.1 ATP-dependent sacrificial sulfur transferase LarE [Lachnospiraceae bacterium]MDY5700687.1 ATP-dependent sacrificial sulfur transferase LarE [Lachnospiraceae bacterium]